MAATVTVTPSATRYHRRALGLTQSGLASAAGVSTSYVKQFEAERLRPSADFLKKISDYFTSQDVKPEKLAAEYSTGGEIATAPRAREGRMSGMAAVPQITVESRQCFYIAHGLPDALVDEFLSRWEKNEDRIAELFARRIQRGLFGDYNEESEAALQEVFALLAENFILFKLLTGWGIIDKASDVTADSVAGVILTHYADIIRAKQTALGGGDAPAPVTTSLLNNGGGDE